MQNISSVAKNIKQRESITHECVPLSCRIRSALLAPTERQAMLVSKNVNRIKNIPALSVFIEF